MISRIRVETRAVSMEVAEREAFLILDHMRAAGYMEGIVPDSGSYTDHHFERPLVKATPADPPDPWTELGLAYAGRMAFTFEPMRADGGIKEYGYKVICDESQVREEIRSARHGEDVTNEVIVLNRQNKVTRDTASDPVNITVEFLGQASTEDVLDNLRRLENVRDVKAASLPGGAWQVTVEVEDAEATGGWKYVVEEGITLRDAALAAYGQCGVTVTHYRTLEPGTPEHAAAERIAGV